jgi:hypothetical protein
MNSISVPVTNNKSSKPTQSKDFYWVVDEYNELSIFVGARLACVVLPDGYVVEFPKSRKGQHP